MASYTSGLQEVFPGSSEMSRMMKEHDWSASALGAPEHWPDGLKIPLRMLLTSRFEMWLGWGSDLNFFYNDAYIPTLGIKHPSMLGKPFREVWAEVYDDVADQVARVKQGQSTWNDALLLLLERHGYPEETYHSFSYSPLYGLGGGVDGMLCIVSEVTARVINERRLNTIRTLGMELVSASTEDAVCQAVCDNLKTNRRDFPFSLLYVGEGHGQRGVASTEDAASLLQRTWPMEASHDRPVTIDLPPHEKFPHGAWAIPPRQALIVAIPGAGGRRPVGQLVLGLNPYRRKDEDLAALALMLAGQISGALAAVAALVAERRRADQIWTCSRDLLVTIGPDGIFQSVSPAWTRILGHDTNQVVGRHFQEFLLPADRQSTKVALSRAASGADLTSFENRYQTARGEIRWISWHTAREGELVYGYGRDITEQKLNAEALASAENALRQSQRMEAVGQLTGGVAHDFNNLLVAIIANLDLLRRHVPKDAKTTRLIDGAIQGANRGASLTQRLLAFARRQELALASIDVTALVKGVRELITKSVGPNIEVRYELDPAIPPVLADVNQVELALLNLVVNARDALPHGGRVTISTSRVSLVSDEDLADGIYVCLAVTDNGTGMDAETLAKATEPFFSTKELGKGTGLGLSMILGLALQLEGGLRLHSKPGEGARAELLLPLTEIPKQVSSPPVTEGKMNKATSQRSILVVDDDPLIAMSTVDMLEDLGHRVTEANSAMQAIELVQSGERFDLVITDYSMPKMNGGQLAEALRQIEPELPIMLATGYAELPPGSELDLPRLAKPYDQSQLQREIVKLLGC
ncbi:MULTISPECIES: PAS domain-containing protein [unclassified Chelatococcus]|uniref:PAS domain-containing protein n=1 Tax=unclassified Chelatococcus TaxID=2638111 RepID=UPI001BCD558B|nr:MULTISPECIES: PAS domain-containing protein [unclassified Chelatococcus]MBS7700571.1 PAS domain-containing protein [Chelatococcus sp. YT9]MBX3558686.1 PAS domain-containing protein [Chelatococcus sp.]